MKIATIIVRLLLGLMFVVFGSNAFLHFMPIPEMPDNPASRFLLAMFHSGYIYAVGALQVAGGLLLIVGRYVPLGLVLLGPIVVNIVLFHIFLEPAGLMVAIIVAVLFAFLVWRYRAAFAPLFRALPPE